LGITIKASQEAGVTAEGNELSAQFFDLKYRGGDPDTVSLDAFLNKAGLITIYLDEHSWVQMSPLVAKQLGERLRSAVGEALANMLQSGMER
jgi:hypothetical protein